MIKLSPLDAMFLLLERRNAPFHFGAVSLFKTPADASSDFGYKLASRFRESCRASPPFDRRLSSLGGVSYWSREANFDIDHHFVHLTMPEGGRISDIPDMVARLHGAHLDRGYPLWRTYLIDGLECGRIATYSKIHHSLVDGVAAMRLMLKSMSVDERVSLAMPPPWDIRSSKGIPEPAISAGTGSEGALAPEAGALRSVRVVYEQIKQTILDFRNDHPDLITSFQAPPTVFNQGISASRRFASRSYSTARIKAVAAILGGGTNDVILALCASALRHYLRDHDALPRRPLIAAVPVSVRAVGCETGNAIAGALVSLATHLADPIERFHAIKRSMDYSKARLRKMTPVQLYAYCGLMLAPGLLTMLPGIRRGIANLVISNVPGTKSPMFWQGCELEGIYPASLLLNGFALNITMVSSHDRIDFGFLGCSRAIPGMHLMLDYLEEALVDLEGAAVAGVWSPATPLSAEEAPPFFPSSTPNLPVTRHSGESPARYSSLEG